VQFGFDFLPSATQTKPSNSSDVLNSPAMKEMLKLASKEYDYVLVDLPPILPVVDVKAVAHQFDAFVLVVEWGSTSSDEILKAAQSSSVLSERLLGAVLNKADETVMRRFEGIPIGGISITKTRQFRECHLKFALKQRPNSDYYGMVRLAN
jgi:polysaccharide biosynthesis transport protein